MAGVLHVSSEDEATGKRRTEIANSYIAKVYFNQATLALESRRVMPRRSRRSAKC